MKKQWEKPELIILTRSKPEEAVLTACKSNPQTLGPANPPISDTCRYQASTCTAISNT